MKNDSMIIFSPVQPIFSPIHSFW